jgi:hypothetical protein
MQDRNLKSRLSTQWPNLLGSNDGFWKIEWDRHGMCSEIKFNQTQYFNLALNIKAQVNVLNALLKKGFKLNNSATYDINGVANAIKEGIPNKSYLELPCVDSNSTIREMRRTWINASIAIVLWPIPINLIEQERSAIEKQTHIELIEKDIYNVC